MSIDKGAVTIYCDVDGVLNVKRKSQGHLASQITRKLPLLVGRILPRFRLWFRWQDEIVKQFVEQIKAADSSFFWLTTWNHEAVTHVEPLTGLISNGVLEYKMKVHEVMNQRRKYRLLKQHQASNPSPFIWIDDVATRSYRSSDWDDSHPHLIIRPDSASGITVGDLERMAKFIAAYS